MIKSITVTNNLGDSIILDLYSPELSGFVIREIQGLGPIKASINATEMATGDGSVYNSARISSRNIVLDLVLLHFPDIETSRQRSYKYFPVKRRVRLIIETDNRIVEIYGYVESNEPVIFTNQVTTQVSIICPDPYFYSLLSTSTIFAGTNPLFAFPFSNESTSTKLIQFGELIINQEQTIWYDGDSEIGIFIAIHAIGEATNLTIANSGSQEVMNIDTDRLELMTGDPIIAGDDIFISTIKGQKSVTLLREGIYTNILNCLDKNADWFQLVRGDNVFAFTAETGGTNLQFRIENQTVYEGV